MGRGQYKDPGLWKGNRDHPEGQVHGTLHLALRSHHGFLRLGQGQGCVSGGVMRLDVKGLEPLEMPWQEGGGH